MKAHTAAASGLRDLLDRRAQRCEQAASQCNVCSRPLDRKRADAAADALVGLRVLWAESPLTALLKPAAAKAQLGVAVLLAQSRQACKYEKSRVD